MKKQVRLIILIFQAIAAVAVFLPWIFSEEYWGKGSGALSPYTLRYTTWLNLFGGTAQSGGILSYLTILIMVASIAAFVLILSGNSNQFTQYGIYSPVLSLLFLVLTTAIRCLFRIDNGINGWWEIHMGWLLYIVLALQIAAAILSVLLAQNKIQDNEPKKAVVSNASNVPEELKKFKALLDSGVISQEEFDTKKSQLLGL